MFSCFVFETRPIEPVWVQPIFLCPVVCASSKNISFCIFVLIKNILHFGIWKKYFVFLYFQIFCIWSTTSLNPANLFGVQSFAPAVTYKGRWFQYQLNSKYWSLKYKYKFQHQFHKLISKKKLKQTTNKRFKIIWTKVVQLLF